ncbi:MAG: hypothetical protein H0T04_01645 [Chloroflexi bacterium]|nr:hypothetical protein [Chloroflexota bacterium]
MDEITLGDGVLAIQQGGQTTQAQVRVTGEALLLEMADAEPVVLLAPAPSESWRLQDVRVTPEGMVVELTVDLRGLAAEVLAPAP